jgi:hypothetical protein
MSLDPKAVPVESQKDYQARIKKNYTINNLEPPFPWKVLPFNPFEFQLHLVYDQHIPTGEQFAEGVSQFFSGEGRFGGAGAGSNF